MRFRGKLLARFFHDGSVYKARRVTLEKSHSTRVVENVLFSMDSVPESQLKDPEVVRLLDEPISNGSQVDREMMEIESRFATLFDLTCEVWSPSFSGSRNLRLLLSCVSNYVSRRQETEETDPEAPRVLEGVEMKDALMEAYSLWLKSKRQNSSCSREDMYAVARFEIPRIYAVLTRVVLSRETYRKWVREYEEYRRKVSAEPVGSAAADYSMERRGQKRGFDQLFDEEFKRDDDRIQQQLTKAENGRLLVLKSPGEIGSHLTRLCVYEVKDVINKDKRHWWKYAKVRCQFLSADSEVDGKQRLVRRLLDELADDLMRIPGVLKEVRSDESAV